MPVEAAGERGLSASWAYAVAHPADARAVKLSFRRVIRFTWPL